MLLFFYIGGISYGLYRWFRCGEVERERIDFGVEDKFIVFGFVDGFWVLVDNLLK